ncbi:hypothetical protein ACIRFH_33840 [Streptomyces sp. NPDC093586]
MLLASDGIHRRQGWNSADGTEGWFIDPTEAVIVRQVVDALKEVPSSGV